VSSPAKIYETPSARSPARCASETRFVSATTMCAPSASEHPHAILPSGSRTIPYASRPGAAIQLVLGGVGIVASG
jgi:hypothetical protein